MSLCKDSFQENRWDNSPRGSPGKLGSQRHRMCHGFATETSAPGQKAVKMSDRNLNGMQLFLDMFWT